MTDDFVFDVATPLGFRVHTTRSYWHYVSTVKHPDMHDRLDDVIATLANPREIWVSSSDPGVYLFYQLEYPGRYICALARKLNGDGFLITAYPTDYIKKGEKVWPK